MLTDSSLATPTLSVAGREQRVIEWVLLCGLVAIFAANAIGAVLEPGSYRHILEASPLSRSIGLHRHSWSVSLIAINDGAIAGGLVAATLGRRSNRRMLALAGAWLAIAAALKLSACIP